MCLFSRFCIGTRDISGINKAKMSTPEARAELKNIVSALLVSSPCAITVDQLERDFSLTMGYGIPFRELGYPTLMKYLESIPDTAVVSFMYCLSSGGIIEWPIIVRYCGAFTCH
jgi:hypothetical protein